MCSSNIKNFCSSIYLTEHLNPEILMVSGINVLMMDFKNYLESIALENDAYEILQNLFWSTL